MTRTLYVHGWSEWQTYRKDRGSPPWIKIHKNVLTSRKWAVLSDQEKGHLVSIWLVAADNGGTIPGDAKVLQKICQLETEPDITRLVDLGLLDANLTPT